MARFKKKYPAPNESLIYVAQIPPAEIAFVNSVIESYEGIGVVRTRDQHRGIIEIWVMDWAREAFEKIVEDIVREVPFTFLKTDSERHDFQK